MTSNDDLLRQFVSWHNNWVLSGNYGRLVGMLHAKARVYVESGPKQHRLENRAQIEAYFQGPRHGDAIDLTHLGDAPIGAQATFRWAKQKDDDDSGTLLIEVVDGQIMRLVFNFFSWKTQPVPILQQKAAPAPAPTKAQFV